MDKMELLTSFINKYRELTLRQFALWSLLYAFFWVVLSLSVYSERVGPTSGSPYVQACIDNFGVTFCFSLISPLMYLKQTTS